MNLPKTLSTVWNKEYGIRPTNNAIINPNTLSAVRNKEYRIRQTIINPKYEDLINDFMDFTYSHEEYPANDKIEDKIIKHSIRTQPSNISLNALINPNIDDLINCYDFEDFIELNEIGQNRHGYVYRAYWDDFKSTVVLKRLEIDINSQEISGFIKELQILLRIGFHPNITRFYGVAKVQVGKYNMIMQFADGGNLREYLERNYSRLQWVDKLRIAENIACGLNFLHKSHIIHRNLHTKNVLVHEGRMMITDFKYTLNEASNLDFHGFPAFIDPLYLTNYSFKLNEKSDIYSFGVILWEISSGKIPFRTFNEREKVINLIFRGLRETPIEGTPFEYLEIYKSCWNENPKNRPDTGSILKDLENLANNPQKLAVGYQPVQTKEKKLVGKLANNSQKLVDGYLEELKSGVDSFRVDQPEQFSTSLFLGSSFS